MLREIYPTELREAVPDPTKNRAQAERWFKNHTGNGAVAARRMASLYTVLTEANPAGQPDEKGRKNGRNEAMRNIL
jgi:hypothetical protein